MGRPCRPTNLEDARLTVRERAYVGLGANVGDARSTLANAVAALGALPGSQLAGVSGLYRTRPVGVTGQPDFLNAVVGLDVPPGPEPQTGALALLAALKQLEAALGRRPRQRWGPREVDLDLLLFGDHAIRAERSDGGWLHVPHGQMAERLFVLAPLAELAPGSTPPGWSLTIADAAQRRRQVEGEQAVQRLADWSPSRGWTPPYGSTVP